MPEYETLEHDVLVIGAGGAGLRAAIEASAAGVRGGVVCKSLLGKAHTVMAEGGIAAALANVDDWRMAQLHAQEAPARVRELEAWGALFDRTPDGRILQRNFGGHAYPRLVHVGDRTGLEMIRTLQDHGVHRGIDFHMECTVIRLLTDAGRIAGAFAYEREGRRFMFDDIPPLYKNQTADNEDEGWRYTQGDKTARRPPELLTRDHVARCIVRETKEGRGSPHGGVFLDIAWIREKLPGAEAHIKNKLPGMYHQFKQLAGVDITREPMEVGPTTHYMMGGVRVDPETQMSTVPGLFAAGECAAGLHGANRLGGNSLSDLLVFGKRAGEFAARFAREHPAGQIDAGAADVAARAALAPFERGSGQDGGPFQVQEELQTGMQNLVGIVRREDEMRRALDRIAELKRRAAQVAVSGNREYNPGWHTALDLNCLLTVSEAITRAALDRKESRGAHFRDDYPKKDDGAGRVTTVIRKGSGGEMQVAREPVPEPPAELKAIIEELK